MRSLKNFLVIIWMISLILFSGCSQSENNKSYDRAPGAKRKIQKDFKGPEVSSRKLIKEGRITFKCDDINKTKESLKKIIKSKNGYISNENQYSSKNRVEISVTIRTPTKHFDSMVEEISALTGKVDSKNVVVKDVTEEYMDIETRIRNDKAVEQKYIKLLKRAKNVNEILAIEKNIGQIRSKIERQEGRIRYLSNQIALSTLHVSFYKTTVIPGGFWNDIMDGFSEGWDIFLLFLVGLVRIWPFLIVIPASIYLFIRIRRGAKKKTP